MPTLYQILDTKIELSLKMALRIASGDHTPEEMNGILIDIGSATEVFLKEVISKAQGMERTLLELLMVWVLWVSRHETVSSCMVFAMGTTTPSTIQHLNQILIL